MANFGNGVSRTLSPQQRQFMATVFQKHKPPLDAEINLGQQIQFEALSEYVRSQVSSGWLVDPTRTAQDYQTAENWSNYFLLGAPTVTWAVVNGWLIPVAGTQVTTEGDTSNKVRLYPPPNSDSRTDFVFLEVWQALVRVNPSVTNKPSAEKIWKYGNVEYGQANIDDDLLDGTTGRETTRRVQLQYRIRVFGVGSGVGSSVSLDVYPDGMDDPNVFAQGTADLPSSSFAYSNMRGELGDPSLWRAGDGNPDNALGTVDGYSYAIPLCAVFRRNSQTFTAINRSGNPNNNGGFDRNPSAYLLAAPREGAKEFATATLTHDLLPGVVGAILVTGLTDSGIDDPNHTLANLFLQIGSEIVGISAASIAGGTITIPVGGRGRGNTHDTRHAAGSVIRIFSARPDGLYADQITATDILDLRRSVSPGDWDYQRLLLHNLSNLAQDRLRSTWKRSGTGDTQGTLISEVDILHADGSIAALNQTEVLDGPDGIRTIFSDAATVQTDVTLLLDNDALLTNGFTADQFDSTVSWDVGAGFKPTGFINNLGVAGSWTNGSVIFFHIGGDSGTEGARATFRSGSIRAVRFLSPEECWKAPLRVADLANGLLGNQNPWTLRFLNQYAMHPRSIDEWDQNAADKHPGPYYPLQEQNFERPFIVLGGVVKPAYKFTNIDSDPAPGQPGLVNGAFGPELRVGIDFDSEDWAARDLLGGRYTWEELYYGVDFQTTGKDTFGTLSKLYVVLHGDTANANNNGAFRVIGAGVSTNPETPASDNLSLRLEAVDPNFATFTIAAGQTLTAEIRSTIMTADDGTGFASSDAAAAVVLTDIQGIAGGESNPWSAVKLGYGTIDLSIPAAVSSKLQVNCSLLYNPGRGATARVPKDIWRISLLDAGPAYLRQAVGSVDASFSSVSGVPAQETFFDATHVQLWNRLFSRGLTENTSPKAPLALQAAFGSRVVAFSEQDREHEVFVDKGSKTLMLRPYQDKSMTLQAITTHADPSLLGTLTYPDATPKDGASIFTSTKLMAFPVPSEYMPRFGRQDIPYHTDLTGNGSGTFLEGINHLFTDSGDPTSPQFSIIGGKDNISGGNLVHSMFFQTGSTSGHSYGAWGTVTGAIDGYQARLSTDVGTLTPDAAAITAGFNAVQSSDLGATLKGIQLPPYLGIARLYGVYDRADFIAKGGQTFSPDRVTPVGDPPTNLLRRGASQQTLFIFANGALDLTQDFGDHTYVIPSEAIDVSKSPYFSVGVKEEFSDFEYVVECSVFGFAKDWISENNYVLARKHNGVGALITDGSDPELESVRMTIPAPATLNDRFYLGYSRVPYQGDPYMTREGSTRTVTDYNNRYGQVSVANAFLLNTPIEQYDSNGNLQVETVNPRALQVLASVDFYTTLGTGKVGGSLFPGTSLDVGYIACSAESATRLPLTSTQPAWDISPRAFTQGQQGVNQTHASLSIEFVADSATLVGLTIALVSANSGLSIAFFAVVGAPGSVYEFSAGATPEEAAQNFVDAVLAVLGESFGGHTNGGTRVATLVSLLTGEVGNLHQCTIVYYAGGQTYADVHFVVPGNLAAAQFSQLNFSGGVNLQLNAGEGTSQLQLTGFTERLPLGILLQDSDFLAENPLNDTASALGTVSANLRPVQSVLPLASDGNEFDRFFGDPGELIAMSDGGILRYEAYNASTSPAGTKRFRLYRGGGSVFVLSGENPGGPVDWVSESWPAAFSPVLKGGILAGKAMLVRNYPETAFATVNTTSAGDELQMVILTYGIMGDGLSRQNGVQLSGVLGSTGYGEGYAAADRYRIEGKPMYSGHSQSVPDPTAVTPAVYPGLDNGDNVW